MVNDIVVVIAGHDKYSAAWPAMMHGLHKYWPDCPWPIYWITNHLQAPRGCRTIRVGGDFNPRHWSNRMKAGLNQIPSRNVLWMLDDHWLTARPDIDALMDFVKLLGRGEYLDRIRLYPGLDHDYGSPYHFDSRLIVMDRKSPYRCSCKPGFWNRQILLSLLKNNESPWDFERNGKRRSQNYVFAITKDWHWFFVTRDCPDGVGWAKSPLVKGKWTVAAKEYCKREGLKINLKKHPIQGNPFGKEKPKYILP